MVDGPAYWPGHLAIGSHSLPLYEKTTSFTGGSWERSGCGAIGATSAVGCAGAGATTSAAALASAVVESDGVGSVTLVDVDSPLGGAGSASPSPALDARVLTMGENDERVCFESEKNSAAVELR